MVTKFVLSRCQQDWIAHGWEECSGCQETMKRDKAKFSLDGAPGPHLLLDMDKVPCLQNKRRCDFLFIAEELDASRTWVVPIECTSGRRKEIKTILQQLRAGAEFIERNIPNSSGMYFRPILVGRIGKTRDSMRNEIETVQFHGKRYLLETIMNNGTIASKLTV